MWGKNRIRSFLKGDAANATVEFVIVFPIVIFLFVAAFETAMLLTRQVMLERSLDNAVRYLRLTSGITVTHDQIAENICSNTSLIPNCTEMLRLDLQVINQDTYALPSYDALCADQANDEVHPANTFNPGADNELMLIRACALVDRILPISGLGLNLTRDDAGDIHLMAATVFVNEPT
ncbi:TadE/TadG family type IV pilus assembly protein [Nioella nitratireducens]|uniref:TadE/TadG family type IV pilus assembly protein n=1 Tax=Nioella nitratireducens TaxID=1287720 RepID=UPI0008FD6242|nr:TadE/TadG family type IV pilus assembly protein [Nioella nitratireducens]